MMAGEADAPSPKMATLSPSFTFGGVHHGADAGGDAAAEQADLFQRAAGSALGDGDLGSTVYSLKVEVPM